MMHRYILPFFLFTFLFCTGDLFAQVNLEKKFLNPPSEAKPWVFWYWMNAAVSRQGITADLEGMKAVGIGGAYLMPIKDTSYNIPFQPTVRQASPEWWSMVNFAMLEAKRLNLKLAMHLSDGFALAGGPWISPEMSMQKLVWTKTYLSSNNPSVIHLEQPQTIRGFYKDVAVMAYPCNYPNAYLDTVHLPVVSNSIGSKSQFLCNPDKDNKQSFKADSSCWIQYKYLAPFTLRSLRIHVGGSNYQAQRLLIQASDDGKIFHAIKRLEPPRHGWQDSDEDCTYSIPVTTAKYFRFVYDKLGTEPGAEDLDAAKWKPTLKIMGIYLSEEPVINQYEAKNGSMWRVATNTSTQELFPQDAVALSSIIDLTDKLDSLGNLQWTPSRGNWVIVRMGHTSTGHTNETAGAAKGLECDKFNPDAVKLQFNQWFAKAFEKSGDKLAKEVLKIFHVDSWECGSQNWTASFKKEFVTRRGYDITPYLLVMAGVPVSDAATSEKILHDVRQTIADLVNDVFYATLKDLAHERGCRFSAESVAPTMVGDGLLHYKNVDIPMGEFWLNSPTHDKPNDMLDAISGAHIYGKKIIGAESFTSLRMNWGEHPGGLKRLGDRNFALGANKLVLHVFAHNPWVDKKPGMTLDGVGLYFQRDQIWFKQGKAWIDYLTRCQALLQLGNPVVDVAVFTGEEIPRRSLLPDRLISSLPGIFEKQKVEDECLRLLNAGQPMRQIPDGVSHSANMSDPESWVDPLNGYAYDSFNPDALMMMKVKNGRVELPGGSSYGVLVIPDRHPMNPNSSLMSLGVAKKILQLAEDGANIIISKNYGAGIGLKDRDEKIERVMQQLFDKREIKGKILFTPFVDTSFFKFGIQKDIEIKNSNHSIAWAHRRTSDDDFYFISNQKDTNQRVELFCRVAGKKPEIWDPINGRSSEPLEWKNENGKTRILIELMPSQSLFIVFRSKMQKNIITDLHKRVKSDSISFANKWSVQFDENYGGPAKPEVFETPISWTLSENSAVKYYSGSAFYSNEFYAYPNRGYKEVLLSFESIQNIATIKVNGIDCGTLWTPPYQLDIIRSLKSGRNKIEITAANTWHNRLIGDYLLPAEKRITWTTAPFRLKDKPLLPAGIIGFVKLIAF